MNPRVISQSVATNPLAAAFISGDAPAGWYESIPGTPSEWRTRIDGVRADFPADWLDRLSPAIEATGKAKERLAASANGRGVVVTTGQQPGLFGGPIYTISKALSALAMADALQDSAGVPVAPVFWAATDDTDFREASTTVVSGPGGAQLLRIDHAEPLGRPMASMPLGDVSDQLDALVRSAGSTIDPKPLELLERFYTNKETIGSAYVGFLRALFAPLGIAVIDASHAATRSAAGPILQKALRHAAEIAANVAEQNRAIEAAGFVPQVQDVPGLSLVFSTVSGSRRRIPIKAAGKQSESADMGPNVLLRPVVERAILPTAAYIGGPAEIAYFAQLGPIADTIGARRPLIVPRWSATIMEPHVARILEKLHLDPDDLRDPHEAESRVARERVPREVLERLASTRASIDQKLDELSEAVATEGGLVSAAVTGGLRANMLRRLDRFERRLLAAAKKEHAETMQEIASARGSLYPFGKPQERALNFVPLLARYGPGLVDDMLTEGRVHAQRLIDDRSHRAREQTTAARNRA
ncbi:MAG TPA: bacillithiol biosynthesis cysteine-adding enzyme BshC [Gemmatimonadaceae bacterium]|jgi:bacillithiol biosynthesis cysteine-adding enzyme BshC|nr:bacillithiol biosynthesis cysteine-adding enzyme BshC [Gemmatimonadaceae bacterium]